MNTGFDILQESMPRKNSLKNTRIHDPFWKNLLQDELDATSRTLEKFWKKRNMLIHIPNYRSETK